MGRSTNSGRSASGGAWLQTALRPTYPLLCADNPRHCSHRPDPHAAPQIGEDYNVHDRPAFGRASPRDQGVFVFHGVAPAAHERTRARMVSRTGEDGRARPLTPRAPREVLDMKMLGAEEVAQAATSAAAS